MEGGLSGNVKVELPKSGEELSFYGEVFVTVTGVVTTASSLHAVQMMTAAVMRSLWAERS